MVIIIIALQGCARNSVQEITDIKSRSLDETAIIVVGISTSSKKRGITIEQVDPTTGRGGDCSRWNRAELDAETPAGEVEYRVFSVPPGAYALSWSSDPLVAGRNENAFLVPAGSVTYLGDFVLQQHRQLPYASPSDFAYQRNLSRAQATLPNIAEKLRPARLITVPAVSRAFVCTP